MYRGQIIHPILMTVITYAMMVAMPRLSQGKAVFAFVMLYLSGSHIYRMWTNFGGWDMDITTYTMILTAKLSAMAYCYGDGAKKDEDLLPEQIERKITKLPSPLEVASYVFFCSACIVGPFFEFSDYVMYIERRGRYQDIPIPIIPSIVRFFQGKCKHCFYLITSLVCLAAHIYLAQTFYTDHVITPEFANYNFFYKVKILFTNQTRY